MLPADLSNLLSLDDFEARALAVLPQVAADYYRSGAWSETTLRENRAAWERLAIHYRVLVDVSQRVLATAIQGRPAAMPIIVAPTAMQCMAHPEGELATARAAGAAGVPMALSCLATTDLADVCRAATGPVWMQLYVGRDRPFVRDLAQRAHAAGCTRLVLTVDNPVWGMRERDIRNGFRVPDGMRIVNLERPGGPTGHTGRGIGESLGWAIDASLTWDDFEWLRDATPLPVIVKGVCTPEDAARAASLGASAIWVSNHGGRQLDTAPATATVLEPAAQAVAGRAEIIVDGGIRRGTDIVKALALGASAVAVGRPILWGLAAAGQAGVERVLALLRAELDTALALSGVPDVRAVPRKLVAATTGTVARAFLLLAALWCAGCQNPAPMSDGLPVTLEVTVCDVLPNQGVLRCALYQDSARFLTREGISAGRSQAPGSTTATFNFTVPSGRPVVVSVFQDLNSNDTLDRGAFGLPAEPWGFSGATEFIGPPTWSACAITPTSAITRITIALIGSRAAAQGAALRPAALPPNALLPVEPSGL